ncbi:MAG TPA: ribbon-helix-helix protein, CopG family [Polyangia bacterium]|nr:ribbon-helix-helix protein, CopG family [Polyangia bacterium]
MTKRINARLDSGLAEKVHRLRERTGRSTTEIVKDSLDAYYEAVMRVEKPAELLAELIGCAEGPADLSRDYKRELGRSLGEKLGR